MDDSSHPDRIEELYNLMRKNIEIERAQREDLKSLDEHIQKVGTRLLLSTVVVYALFAGLCAVGAYLWIDLTTRSYKTTLKKAQTDLAKAREALEVTRKETERKAEIARHRSERVARHFHQFASGSRKKLLKEHNEVAGLAQTALEREVVRYVHRQMRQQAALEAYADGVAAYNRNHKQGYKTAVEKLELSLKYDASGSQVPSLRYYLGVAYYKLQRYRKATKQLEALAQSSRSSDLLDERALFHLAHAHELLKQENLARKHYLKYLKKFPAGAHASLVRQKLKLLPRPR